MKVQKTSFLHIVQKCLLFFAAILLTTTNPVQPLFAALDGAILRDTVFYDENFNICANGGIVNGVLPAFVPEPYNGAFTKGANEYNVAPALVAAIFSAENFWGLDPTKLPEHWPKFIANHPDPNSGWPISSANATGPFQFLPSTFTGLKKKDGGKYDIANINNLVIAAEAAANYLASNGGTKDKSPHGPEWRNAIARYNKPDWYYQAVMKFFLYYNAGVVEGASRGESSNDGCGTVSNCEEAGVKAAGKQAILCEARKFEKFGYLWGGGHEDPEKFMARFNSSGGYNQPFKQILDCSGIVSVSIWNAFKVKTYFNTASIGSDTKNFKHIHPNNAQPGDIMVREGHMEIATNPGGTETYGAHTDQAPPDDQIGDAKGQKWEAAYVYIGKGSGDQPK